MRRAAMSFAFLTLLASLADGEEQRIEDLPPVVVATQPACGANDVDPSMNRITVTFNKKMMDQSWSWVQVSEESFPKIVGDVRFEGDGRTCVLPVELEEGKTYVLWINKGRYLNFKDADQRSAVPYLLYFRTR